MPSNVPGSVKNGGEDQTNLYLNIYDLSPANKYLYWFGLGVYHTGIEVHGKEYAFGAHEYPTSGVFEVEPKHCPGFVFRRSLFLGGIEMPISQFRLFMEHLSVKYHGDTYHLIAKNCNHFSNDVCKHLTGKSIPGWVNRLAKLGSFCSCLLPKTLQVTSIKPPPVRLASSAVSVVGSLTSSARTQSDDDMDHRLLTTPNGDVAFLAEKPLKLSK